MNSPDEDRTFSIQELDTMIPELLLIEAWAAAVRARILACLQAGAEMENAWLEPTRGTRKWIRDDNVVAQEIDDVLVLAGKPHGLDATMPRSLLSPAAAEKLVGRTRFSDLLSSLCAIQSTGNMSLKLKSGD